MSINPDKDLRDPENYKFGVFYYNPKDKRIVVPKRDQYRGWTLNFGNFYAYLILIGLVVIIWLFTAF